MALPQQMQEFLDSLKVAAADGRYTLDECTEVVVQFVDMLRLPLAALDGNAEATEQLVENATACANAAIDLLPGGRFLSKPAAKAGVAFAVPWLVRSAATAGKPVDLWLDDNVVPLLRAANQVTHALLVAFGG